MLQQPDRQEFIEEMKIEIQQMFDKEIMETVSKREMKSHYKNEQKRGNHAKRKQIILIW